MEHEVFVPVPGERLRAVLGDPARVARAVPGLQQDDEPLSGRLRLRVGGHTITYRGTLRITAGDDGSYAVEADATEARGSGSVKPSLTLRLTAAAGGTRLSFAGTATADGRIAELPAEEVTAAVTRLLNRFGEGLAEQATPESPELLSAGQFETAATTDFETTPDADDEPPPLAERPPAADEDPAPSTSGEQPAPSVFDTEVPPPSLDPLADEDDYPAGLDDDLDDPAAGLDGRPVAEAAHARRTMIGRSAEEVDHAPPRGRYAPVPVPQTVSPASAALRWAVPAAAVVVASAVVAGRVLRRRH
ncbi:MULTISPECIES: SRPBCC domain-containing protein [Streptomyces]|uniref:Carbon monoxide dehydrogenase n=2 Tax=Streptomyces TaxID=1883 RepID=A0A2U9P5X9_STRAS|nr:SRPBCC domain-containing protein [Streptomyces actuosus]AWT44505.1 carbon monoxide dehydrogenase [Streptomyces actuosus]MBM4820300.1 carbon monoxide dehydrogenase [Streptomyces actuosus]